MDNLTEVQPGNILIVDDTPANLKVLTSMLIKQGHQVRPAINGMVALIAVHEVPPDLILLDIAMPIMDGYEVCRQLKANPATQAIPVIFISAMDSTEDKVKAFSMGGVDYITKPFQVSEVLARVNTHLTICRLQASLQEKNQQLHEKNRDLQDALAGIKTLTGLLPICSNCKKIRNDEGYWQQVEVYLRNHTEVEFTHGICPECMEKLYPEFARRNNP